MTTPEQILIIDGECAVCRACARWIEARWTRPSPPVIVASQHVHDEFPRLATPSDTELRESLWWIEGDRREPGARAVARALIATSSPWRLVGAVVLMPPLSWLAAGVYRIIARHRHRLPGATAACATPAGEGR